MRLEVAKVRDGSGSGWGEGVKREALQRERDCGDSFLATTDSSIQRQYHTAFCALRAAITNQPFIWTASCR